MKNTHIRIINTVYRIPYKIRATFSSIQNAVCKIRSSGFTLLETMIAVTLLSVAIVAPMSLTTQSLATAYYARDQITAFFLAQEALEALRNVRDNNILANSQGTPINLLFGIPVVDGSLFRIDALTNPPVMTLCSGDGLPGGECAPLQTDGTLYGYGIGTNTQFTRTVVACFIQLDGTCSATESDEVKFTVSVSWRTGGIQLRTVRMSQNLYRWVNDGSASQ